ncbi:Crp/Fnr family transcriptional regulator [Kaistia terrae]|jgi:CRP/FNR family cyclic AMP-dependent transcriptional regulator|uniref:Crp/Fnr family transcriptional regulator n=1 Tax=Kaistia terrae TaxID=537017 RepID=A0ABW0PUC8_9HYPH|nr:cyclic nucleotide-binding domain-containing protein [Kaistia terrae]MCX5576765.1 cyclic nucleotide-binding domain-containing protein [Kaistia terrae]
METRDVLGRTSLFADVLSDRQLDDLAARSKIYDVGKDRILMAEGDFGVSMFVIVDGKVDVTVAGTRHANREVAMLGPGDIFGEMSLMTGARRAATVTSVEPTRVVEITKVALENVLTHSPELVDRFGAFLAKRRAELEEIADDEHATRILGIRTDEIVGAMRRLFGR